MTKVTVITEDYSINGASQLGTFNETKKEGEDSSSHHSQKRNSSWRKFLNIKIKILNSLRKYIFYLRLEKNFKSNEGKYC